MPLGMPVKVFPEWLNGDEDDRSNYFACRNSLSLGSVHVRNM